MNDTNIQRGALLASLAIGAGAIHLAMVPSHANEWLAEGIAFAIVGWLQIAAGVALARRPTPFLRMVVAAASAGAVLVWAISRTSGLPFGPESGVKEAVTFVDLVCVSLEVALILALVALPLLDRRPRRLTWGVSLAAVALATMAMASPSAQNHAHHESGTATHTHDTLNVVSLANGHTHVDDFKPYKPMSVADFKLLGEQLDQVREITLRYPTVGAALDAGFVRRGAFIPGQGAHYFPPFDVMRQAKTPFERPLAWLYSGIDETSVVVGVMYGQIDFAGTNERFHYHDDVCVAIAADPDGSYKTFSESQGMTKAQCDTLGGMYIAHAGPLMHVWTVPGWESPIGVFSHDNPLVACTDGQKPADVHHSTGGCKGLG